MNEYTPTTEYLGFTDNGDDLIKAISCVCFLTYTTNKTQNLKGPKAKSCYDIISIICGKDESYQIRFGTIAAFSDFCQNVYSSAAQFTGLGMDAKQCVSFIKEFVLHKMLPF